MKSLRLSLATLLTMLSIALPAVASPVQRMHISASSLGANETVVVRTTANAQVLAMFTKNRECLKDFATAARIVGCAGTIISRSNDHYTLHYGEALITTVTKPMLITSAQGGCRLPAHSTAIVRYRPGSFFQAEVLRTRSAIAVRLKQHQSCILNAGEQLTLTTADSALQISELSDTDCKVRAAQFTSHKSQPPSRIFAQPGSVFSISERTGIKLIQGRLLVCAKSPLNVESDMASFNVKADEFVALESFAGRTRIHALNQADCLSVTTTAGRAHLDCGRELLITSGNTIQSDLLPCDGIGRRVLRQSQTPSSATLVISEYAMLGLLKYHPSARVLRADSDTESQRILSELVKTCAAIEYVNRSHGNYTYGTPSTTKLSLR